MTELRCLFNDLPDHQRELVALEVKLSREMNLMRNAALEVFKLAGVDPDKNPELFNKCQEILGYVMARGSVLQGLSMQRIKDYDDQKKVLIDDLLEMKTLGQIND